VAEIPARLGAVLEVVYLIFNEGHGPHSSDRRRRSLCREASMPADQLTELAPTMPEVWGLAALLKFQSSRFDARLGDDLFRALVANAPTESQRRLYQGRLTECVAS
jgi:RNA polymerase sigma-70 factor, ECF subfamily